jgi:hypothetical protein
MYKYLIIFVSKLMPRGIIFKCNKGTFKTEVFECLFSYFRISGDFRGIFRQAKTPTISFIDS